MYKVVIVDDEAIIRRGLKNIINWRELECEICGEAKNGEEGVSLIKREKPEIIITDINMPGIDGLVMIKEIKEVLPDSKVIILTGYRDFEYTQEAIRLGAFDYVLKPSRIEDITKIVIRAVEEIKQQNKREAELKKMKREFENKLPILREKLIYDIIFKPNYKVQEVEEELQVYGICIDKYIIMALEIDEDNSLEQKGPYERRLYQFGIINTFEDLIKGDFTILNVPVNSKMVIFVIGIKGDNPHNTMVINTIYNYCLNLQELVRNCFNFTVTIALSTFGNNPEELGDKAKEAMEALEYKFYMGKNTIIFYDDLKSLYKTNDLSDLEDYERVLIQSIKLGNEKSTQDVIDSIISVINEGNVNKEEVKKFFWSIINKIYTIPSEMRINDEYIYNKTIIEVFLDLKECESVNELSEILREISNSVSKIINNFNKKTLNQTLKKALTFIDNNYQKPLTLNDVAENTYVSIYYLSRMFTKELGKNFIDYLNEVRVERAKEYLKDGNYKTYEIADLVGIKDAHYFSKIFKKYTGVTPSDYKSGCTIL